MAALAPPRSTLQQAAEPRPAVAPRDRAATPRGQSIDDQSGQPSEGGAAALPDEFAHALREAYTTAASTEPADPPPPEPETPTPDPRDPHASAVLAAPPVPPAAVPDDASTLVPALPKPESGGTVPSDTVSPSAPPPPDTDRHNQFIDAQAATHSRREPPRETSTDQTVEAPSTRPASLPAIPLTIHDLNRLLLAGSPGTLLRQAISPAFFPAGSAQPDAFQRAPDSTNAPTGDSLSNLIVANALPERSNPPSPSLRASVDQPLSPATPNLPPDPVPPTAPSASETPRTHADSRANDLPTASPTSQTLSTQLAPRLQAQPLSNLSPAPPASSPVTAALNLAGSATAAGGTKGDHGGASEQRGQTSARATVDAESTLENAHERPLAAQIARGLTSALAQASRFGTASTTIRLNPGTLGQLRIRVRLDGDAVHARFEVFNPQARGLLTPPLSELRGRLAERGLTLAQFEIVDAAPSHNDPHAAETTVPRPSQRPEDAGGPASTIHAGSSEHDLTPHGLTSDRASDGDTPPEPRRPRDERPPPVHNHRPHQADSRFIDERPSGPLAAHHRHAATRLLDTLA